MRPHLTHNRQAVVAGFIALLVLLIGYSLFRPSIHRAFITNSNTVIPMVDFSFDVYCPVSSASKLAAINEALGYSSTQPALQFDFALNPHTYIVIAKTQPSTSDPQSSSKLYYCGLARKWSETNCNAARLICSIPGPMFYFPVKQAATIIWINDIHTGTVNWTRDGCYDKDSKDQECTVTTKNGNEECSYYSPTNYQGRRVNKHRIDDRAVPISPHIHGLEQRPSFDGNPLAWFNTEGDKGPGFNSLLNTNYYTLFNNILTSPVRTISPSLSLRTKVITVTNDQLPGMLFYHDHSMKSTLYNVQYGLSGLYVIYDQQVEAGLPKGEYERFMVFCMSGDSRMVVSSHEQKQKGSVQPDVIKKGNYRLRILNAHFTQPFGNITFAMYYKTIQSTDGNTHYQQIDPTSPSYNLTHDKHKITFNIIGADTTLFDKSVDDVQVVSLGPAERVDILINFDSSMPQNIEYVYVVCLDPLVSFQGVLKYRFRMVRDNQNNQDKQSISLIADDENLAKKEDNPQYDPTLIRNVSLPVPFTDLSLIPDSQIAVKRHRPMLSLPNDKRFMLGAHYMFQQGGVDYPQIGTFQDFYIVNFVGNAHPMHLHLVNFQVVQKYILKRMDKYPNCTLYMMDYFRQSGLPQLKLTNEQLCVYIGGMGDEAVLDLFSKWGNYMREDQVVDRVSGLDSMKKYNGDQRYLVDGCEWNTRYLYLCKNNTQKIDPYKRKWKDTLMISDFHVAVMRVRWASTGYQVKEGTNPYPYFKIPEDQLVQFPGFVYHCHILTHEDNQMMRPFMLTHSAEYLRQYQSIKRRGSCAAKSWAQALKCINGQLQC